MKPWNESRSARLTALALVLSVFAACDDNGNGMGVTDDDPDPVEQAQTLEALTQEFFTENEGVQTLNVLAPLIAGVGFDITPALSVINLREPGLRQFADNVKAMRGYGRAGGSGAELMASIPVGLIGKVLVLNPQTLLYEIDPGQQGPANGVRFILYAVDPVLGQLVIPLVEVGALDIIDTSQFPTINVQMIVDIGGSTALDISTSATGDQTSFSMTADGFIAGDGAQLDIDFSLDASFPSETDFDLTANITLSSGGVSVTADLSVVETATSSVASISLAITAPDGSISFDVEIDDVTGDLTGTVSFGTDVVAIITADAQGNVTITNAEGGDLTQAELVALGAILDGFFEVFEAAFGIVGLIFIILGFAFI